jgi:hypothetical protein
MSTFARVQRPAASRGGPIVRGRSSAEHEDARALTAPGGWSFASVPLTAPHASGSSALESENEEGPVGQHTGHAHEAEHAGPAHTAPPTHTHAPAHAHHPPAHATPARPTITSATAKAAPSGAANTRKRVGVGEVVVFTGSAAGTWSASAGTASGASSTTFRWTAPPTAATVTITLRVGTTTATERIHVVAPSSISMRKRGSHTSLVGAGGACMLCEVTIHPTNVCLGAIQWLEVPGPGTSVSGFFKKFSAATLRHHPNTNYALIGDDNIMEAGPHNANRDHCAWHSTPGPYRLGSFEWRIPNRYIVDGEAASAGRHFCNTTQHFTMSAAGRMRITKAGAST